MKLKLSLALLLLFAPTAVLAGDVPNPPLCTNPECLPLPPPPCTVNCSQSVPDETTLIGDILITVIPYILSKR